jgi:stage II sporulation protein GA (sporulation sigma-E factor processing peptidase)
MIAALILIPGAFLLIWLYRRNQSTIRETYEVELIFQNRSFRTKGLLDTGNCLYDPIFKKPVIIIEKTLLNNLMSTETRKELEAAESCLAGKKDVYDQWDAGSGELLHLKIIPYQSIGEPRGMMLAFVLDKVFIYRGNDKICNERVTAAICDNCLSTKEEYHVILHKELLTGC